MAEAKAFQWWKFSAEQGNSDGQFHTGYNSLYGVGIENLNELEGISWYRKAAEQNHPQAQYNLAILYRDGISGILSVDLKESFKWCQKAAEQGFYGAQQQLSFSYWNAWLRMIKKP